MDGAAAWYEARRPGLGILFADEVERGLDAILESPNRWPTWPGVDREPPVRRYVLSLFPFVMPYIAFQDRVHVLAVAHMSRRPGIGP